MRRLTLAAGALAVAASAASAQDASKPLDNPCLIKEVLLDYYRAWRDPSRLDKWGGLDTGPFNERIKTLDGVSCNYISVLVEGVGGDLSPSGKYFFLQENGIEISISCDPDTNRIMWAFFRPQKSW